MFGHKESYNEQMLREAKRDEPVRKHVRGNGKGSTNLTRLLNIHSEYDTYYMQRLKLLQTTPRSPEREEA